MRPPPRTMVALITPFVENGSIDGPAHRHNLAKLAEWEVGGFLIGEVAATKQSTGSARRRARPLYLPAQQPATGLG